MADEEEDVLMKEAEEELKSVEMRVALVCQSNVNRSMAAHDLLQRNGMEAESYGVGHRVKIPGETIHQPNVYEFGTPYDSIFNDLMVKNKQRSLFNFNFYFNLIYF